MERLEERIPGEEGGRALEACGRGCIGKDRIRRARRLHKLAKDLDETIAMWNSAHITGPVSREGDVIYVTYPRCYCGQVSAAKTPLPRSYCECSRGWVLALSEGALGVPASVDLLESVQRGDKRCRFAVRLEGKGP